MRLSLHTDYALRVLMYLAARERQASVGEIARAYGISHHHLVKVAQRLADIGLVTSRRGRGGGIALARSPDGVNVGAVVRELESLSGFVECFDPDRNTCPVIGVCGLQRALSGAVAAFLDHLDGYRLSDLVSDPGFAARLDRVEQASSSVSLGGDKHSGRRTDN